MEGGGIEREGIVGFGAEISYGGYRLGGAVFMVANVMVLVRMYSFIPLAFPARWHRKTRRVKHNKQALEVNLGWGYFRHYYTV